MSRSYKEPWVKDPANRYMKAVHARRMRRVIHTILSVWKKANPFYDYEGKTDDPEFPDPRMVTCPYNICDFIFKDSSPKGLRK